MGNEDVRRQIAKILDQVRHVPRQRAIEPAVAVAQYLRARGAASEDEAQAVTEIAVDEQLSRGHSTVVEDALLALAELASDATLDSEVDRISAVNVAITACMLVDRLAQRGRVTPEQQLGVCSCANLLDDRLVRDHGRYPRRAALLQLLRDGVARVSDRVRHLDLVARFKWAIELAASDDDVLTLDAVEVLRALIPAIEQRIAETVDAPGPGTRPDGAPVATHRIAEPPASAGPLRHVEPYHSLPRLRAQAWLELGRLLASLTFSSSTAGLEEAHAAFERASIAFQAASDARSSAQCAVSAAQCLAWLADDLTGPHARRLFDDGQAAHRQVLAAGLPEDMTLPLAALARGAYQRVMWHVRLLAAPSAAEAEAAIMRMYQEATILLVTLRQQADREPWAALACGGVAIEYLADFLETAAAAMPPPADEDEQRARKAQSLDTLRHYVTTDVIDAMAHALSRALDAPAPSLRDRAPASAAPDVWTPRAAPIAMTRRLHDALSALLRAAAIQQGLSEAQWAVVARAMEGVRPMALGTAQLLTLRKREGHALVTSIIAGLAPPALAAHLERRIARLERHLANPVLSVAERLLLSGWISHLVQLSRMWTEDLASLPAPRVLALIERTGASMFRSDTLLFGRGVLPAQGYQLVDHARFDPAPPALTPSTNAWTQVHLARNLLDFWSRAKMIREASRVDPNLHEEFADAMHDPPMEVLAFPPEVPLEQIQRLTSATADQCDVRPDRTVVRFRPEDLAQIDRHLDHMRRWLASALQSLAAQRELRAASFARCPEPDPAAIERWLARDPSIALIVPGYFPEIGSPLNVFSFRDDTLRRDTVSSGTEAECSERLASGFELIQALREDLLASSAASWHQLGQAIDRITATCAAWSRALATHLDAHGLRKLVFVLRGPHAAQIPWEVFPTDDRGTLLGDRFEIVWVYTLAQLPDTPAPRARSGTSQVYGSGHSAPQMELGAVVMRSLADAGLAHPPRRGDELCTPEGLSSTISTTARARFFLHGHHDQANPDADRLTLVDDEDARRCINLHARDMRQLPLAGMDCVELWACEGAAHDRPLQEHGVSDEPEDLTAALLLAGAHRVVASRWHVPTLASALIQERFALFLHGGARESVALSSALREYRAAFAAGGPLERRLQEAIGRALDSLAAEAADRQRSRRDELLQQAFIDSIDAQRAAWYRGAGLEGPAYRIGSALTLDRMTSSLSPHAERITASPEPGADPISDPISEQLTEALLAPYRNPASWCGWRVTLRDPRYLD